MITIRHILKTKISAMTRKHAIPLKTLAYTDNYTYISSNIAPSYHRAKMSNIDAERCD